MFKPRSSSDVKEDLTTDPGETMKVAQQSETGSEPVSGHTISNGNNNRQSYVTVGILCLFSFVFSMDFNGPSGLLLKIKASFDVSETLLGLISLMFVIGCIIVGPIIGFLADRYSRRAILVVNVTLWSCGALASTFVPDNLYGVFLALRVFEAIGSSTHSAIVPAIISDLFIGNRRSQLLALYYFTIPVGGGLGYILFSLVGNALGWRWGMRITPLMGFGCALLIAVLVRDPKRGQSDGVVGELVRTSLKKDFKYLSSNKSYVLCCLATISSMFVIGSLSVWGPAFYMRGIAKQDRCNQLINSISSIFGAVSIVAGIIGILSGSVLGQKLRPRFKQSCDPLICGWTMLASVPLMFASLMLADVSIIAAIAVTFFAVILYYMSLALSGEVILYVLVPNRRSVGKAVQNLFNHLLGDGGGPFVIGLITDAIKPLIYSDESSNTVALADVAPTECATAPFINYETLERDFLAQQYSLFVFLFIQVISASSFLALSWFIAKDVEVVKKAIAENNTRKPNEK